MKSRLFILALFAFSFSLQSCYDFADNSISGSGDVISEIRTVSNFHGIDAAAGLKVFVEFGEMSNEIEVLADDNLMEYIITEVEGGILRIKTRKNIRNAESKEIYVKAGKIDYIEASSAAKLYGTSTLEVRDIIIESSSAARIELEIIADEIDVEISSSGKASLSGDVENLIADISSAGDLAASSLKARDCRIEVSSAGHAKIYVFGELSAEASSAGHIKYEGDPQIKQMSKSSAGSISGD